MKLLHKLDKAVWWLLNEVAPTLILCIVVAVIAYTLGEINALKFFASFGVCP